VRSLSSGGITDRSVNPTHLGAEGTIMDYVSNTTQGRMPEMLNRHLAHLQHNAHPTSHQTHVKAGDPVPTGAAISWGQLRATKSSNSSQNRLTACCWTSASPAAAACCRCCCSCCACTCWRWLSCA